MSEPRILLVSSAPPSWDSLTAITWRTMAKYAAKHGYGFHTDVSDISAQARSPEWGKGVDGYLPLRGFIKLDLLLHFLDERSCRREWDWVVWLDADMMPTRYDIPLSQFQAEHAQMVVPFDANGFNATVIMAKNTPLVRDFLWASNAAGRTMFLKHDWAEMEAMRYFSQTQPYRDLVWMRSVQELCAMPPGVYPIPEVTRKQYEWTPESLAVHFSALDVPTRTRMAAEWVERLGLLP